MRIFPTALFVTLMAAPMLAACSTPEPQIITKEVHIAVPTPCDPTLPARPALMDKDQVKAALATAPAFDDRVKILSSQLLLYMGWTPIVEAALNGCKSAPPPPKATAGN